MRQALVEKLRCPADKGDLAMAPERSEPDGHIMEGRLLCSVCGSSYEITGGIPRMLPSNKKEVEGNPVNPIQRATIERFGFEWCYFKDWGWLAEYPKVSNAEEKFFGGLLEHSERAFWGKSLFQRDELRPGMTVLDAGCGNGRFTNEAAKTGAEVIGIDLGRGVQSAFEHMRSFPNVHVLQGDLFKLPFGEAAFDRIFSIGVLMHTGNAGAAFDSLTGVLKPGGLIVAHVYGKGRTSYELIDSLGRKITTRMPLKMQIYFARATAAISRRLRSGGGAMQSFYSRLFSHVNLLPTEIHMFDWWSAPVATHHTQEEVHAWFARNGLAILRTNPPAGDVSAERARRHLHAAITVLGRRS